MHEFCDELCQGLDRCSVRQTRVVVAVSGGADSVALFCGLVEVAAEFSLELHIAHLNHRLRGADSDADAAWVADLATALNLPVEIGSVATGELSADASGVEEKARKLRHRFLDESATKFACPVIAVAHSADDQAETVLHHMLRGTGIAGLCGIPPVRQTAAGHRLVRPMLAIRRCLIESYLADHGQSYRTDETNVDTAMTRNKLRHVVLPLLRKQVNPQVDVALCRLAEQAMEIDDFLTQSVNQLLEQCRAVMQPESCRLDISGLAEQPRHVVRALFRELWKRQEWQRQAMGFDQWNRLVEMLFTRETITLPNRIEARFHSENLLVLRRLGTD